MPHSDYNFWTAIVIPIATLILGWLGKAFHFRTREKQNKEENEALAIANTLRNDLMASLAEYQAKLQQYRREMAQKQEEIALLKTEIQIYRNEVSERDRQISDLRSRLAKLEEQINPQ
jgi:septal ring factor EnvC (AmiA/AmiB activator)